MAREGLVRVAYEDGAVTFEVIGRVTMLDARAVRRELEQRPGAGPIRVDLRRCGCMDSTFLGTLLYLKRMGEATGRGFTLISPSVRCERLLRQMGLDDIFPVVAMPPAGGPWRELSADSDELAMLKRHLVEAHQELASRPGSAGEPFRDLAKRLAREWDAERRRGRPQR